jgi:RDD family protein
VLTDEPAPRPSARRQHDHAMTGSVVPDRAQPVQGLRAGLVSRLLADTIDAGVVVVALGAGYLGVVAVKFLWRSWAFTMPTPSFLLMLACAGVIAVVYLTAAWATTGRSAGKHLMGLRVVGPFGRLRLGGAFVRAVLCVVVPIGVLWVAVSRHNRSLQDAVLRTSVVYDWIGGPQDAPVHPPGRTAGAGGPPSMDI